MTEQFRQGDLFFQRIDKLPKGLRKRTNNVILEGEATGHAHRLMGGTILEEQWRPQRSGVLFLEVPQEGKVVHEEHATIVIPEGFWRVQRQREYQSDKDFSYVLD